MSTEGSIDIISPRVAFLGDTRLLTIGQYSSLWISITISHFLIILLCNRSRWGPVTVGRLLKIIFYTWLSTKDHFSSWFLMKIITPRKMKQFLSYSLQSAYILFSKLYKLYFFLAISYAVSFQEDFALTLWEVIPKVLQVGLPCWPDRTRTKKAKKSINQISPNTTKVLLKQWDHLLWLV